MAEGYEVRSHDLATAGMRVLVLSPEEAKEDFLEKLKSDSGAGSIRYREINRVLERIQYTGVAKSIHIGFVKVLEGNLALAEVRIPGKVIRVMTYVHGLGTKMPELVLLFDFKGHRGSDKISKNDMKRGRNLAKIAKKSMEEE